MSQSVNLIPQQEVSEQYKAKALKFSTIITIIILIAVGSVSMYYFNTKRDLETELKNTQQDIEGLRSEIQSLSLIEISARNLYQKFQVLTKVFSSRKYYSSLTKELEIRRPPTIELDGLSLQRGTELDVSGTASNYITIAEYMNNLLNNNFEGGDPNLKSLFTSVSLTSVRLEQERGIVRFAILIKFDEGLLNK